MIANKTTGEGFSPILDYVLRKRACDMGKAPAEHIGGTVWGDITEMTQQFEATVKMRPTIKNPVIHFSLSLPSGDGRLDSLRWLDIAEDFMCGMRFPLDTAWVAVRHADTAHDHVHIVASRISMSGKVWDDSNDFLRGMAVTSHLEKEYGLARTDKKRKGRRIKASDFNRAQRGVLSERVKIMELVDQALALHPAYEDFKRILGASGVTVIGYRSSKKARLKGITFELSGVRVKGSQLGRGYSAPGLIARGLKDYDKEDVPGKTAKSSDSVVRTASNGIKDKNTGSCIKKDSKGLPVMGAKTAAALSAIIGFNPCRGCLNPTNCGMCAHKAFKQMMQQKNRYES